MNTTYDKLSNTNLKTIKDCIRVSTSLLYVSMLTWCWLNLMVNTECSSSTRLGKSFQSNDPSDIFSSASAKTVPLPTCSKCFAINVTPKKPDDVTIINYCIIILNKIKSWYNLNTNKINFLFYYITKKTKSAWMFSWATSKI